ncbi:MAG: DUF1553 domain-containing protein [Anditalea sp.]
MSKKIFLLIFIAISGILAYWLLQKVSKENQNTVFQNLFYGDQEIDFNGQIRPILNKNCISCHGGVKQSAGFSLLFPSEALRPNESGKPAIVPGKPEESEMISRINHHDPELRMPLEADPLSEEEIELLTEWIEQGAEWEDHWAFKKLEPVGLPAISADWINNDIDKFVLKKLGDNDLQPSPQADKATLLRRVSLDLVGLPPTMNELQDFLNDEDPDAYEKVVDRLLASPRYGERWAAMWMDLARYADSKGYEADRERSIWKYRDWLIKAFNEDMPFDQFTKEQLAGDLLPDPTDDQLIATAFHRNTMNNDEGGTDNEEFRVAAVIDRVNTTWSVWQATTMECVQCHSHPYDPIRHEDFYKSYAFFNNTADEDVPSESPELKIFTADINRQELESIKNWVVEYTASADEKMERAKAFVDLVKVTEPKIHPHSFEQIEKGTVTGGNSNLAVESGGHALIKNVPLTGKEDRILVSYRASRSTGIVEIRKDSPEGDLLGSWNVEKNERGFETIPISIKPVSGRHDIFFVFKDSQKKGYVCQIEWVLFHEGLPGESQPGYQEVNKKFLSLLNSQKTITTPVMVELEKDYRRKTNVFERGNWMMHGEEVEPGVPDDWNALPENATGNRLDLAEWLMSEDNPLTARVMVNRLWAQLFGIGIVETIEDFGSMGFAPSHSGLLDWLAQQFMYKNEWSIKKLLKQVVMSATYQQSSKVIPQLLEADPDNRLLARGPRVRLNAEQVRDQALAVSGLLSDKMYGPGVMPPQPEGLWQTVYNSEDFVWETSKGEDKYRRALYTFWRRTNPYPSLISFDSPSREVCVLRRTNTNTPLQAFVTLNDPVYVEAAQALAEFMAEANVNLVDEQIKAGYRMAMLRDIGKEKLHDLQLLHEKALGYFKNDPEAAEKLTGKKDIKLAVLTVVASAIMNLDEFITKS